MSRGLVGIAVVGYGYWGPNLVRNFSNTEGAQRYRSQRLGSGEASTHQAALPRSYRND